MGRRGGRPDRQSGDRRAHRQGPALRPRRGDWRDRGGGSAPSARGRRRCRRSAPQILRRWFDLIIAQPRRHRAHHDQRAGQAARRSARRGRLRRRLRRILRRGGQAHLRRDRPDLPRRFAHRRHQAADRRRRRDHAVELSGRDDHPQGRAGARRRLHGGRQARAARRRSRRWRSASSRCAPACPPGVLNFADRRSARDRQGDVRTSGRALRRLHRLDRGRQAADARRRRER